MTLGPHVTLAHSSGAVWLMLLTHVLGGTTAVVSGFAALLVAKGGRAHRRTGMVFVVAMAIMGSFATVVATYEGKVGSIVAGIFSVYFILTGLTTVRPIGMFGRREHIALMLVPLAMGALLFTYGFIALGLPGASLNGVPAAMMLFLASVNVLAAIGDWRMIWGGGVGGARKVARHLWRMCFGMFIATGSFFIGQMQVFPKPLRILPLMLALGVAPLGVLLYWMWRVRLRQSLRGLIISKPREVASPT
jgi:hypothetical protein